MFRYSAGAHANILWSAGVRERSEVTEVMDRLQAAGMPTLDISDMEAARVSNKGGKGKGWAGLGDARPSNNLWIELNGGPGLLFLLAAILATASPSKHG